MDKRNIEEQIGHSRLSNTAIQYPKHLRKQRQDLIKGWLKQSCRKFLREDFAIQIMIDCRTIPAVEFRRRLRFKQQDPIMTQEQSVLTKIRQAVLTEVCNNKKSMFISKNKRSGLFSILGIRTLVSKIPGLNHCFNIKNEQRKK